MKETDLDKTTLRLMMMVAMLFATTVLTAQPSTNKRYNQVDYVNESHLLRKGDKITIVHINFEWPKYLSGMPTKTLQKSLCRILFNNGQNDLDKGLTAFLKKQGEEIHQIPDEDGLETIFINLKLQTLAWERDKYISLRAISSFRYDDDETLFYDNDLLTYDIVADKVLKKEEIFKWTALDDDGIKNYIAENILRFSQNDSYEIRLDNIVQPLHNYNYAFHMGNLPDQACLMPDGVLFNIPGTANEEAFDVTSIVPLEIVSRWMTPQAKKTLSGENKRRKNKTEMTKTVENDDTTTDTTLVYDYAPTMPKYNGEEKDMMAFIHRNVTYPSYEKSQGIQGKVVVSFVVERDGFLSAPSVITPVSPGIDRQAVMAVMAMPRWKPGMKDGVPVRVRMNVPVFFKMADGE